MNIQKLQKAVEAAHGNQEDFKENFQKIRAPFIRFLASLYEKIYAGTLDSASPSDVLRLLDVCKQQSWITEEDPDIVAHLKCHNQLSGICQLRETLEKLVEEKDKMKK